MKEKKKKRKTDLRLNEKERDVWGERNKKKKKNWNGKFWNSSGKP